MYSEGITSIGDGLLDIDEKRLDEIIFKEDINELYDVEQTPFARWVLDLDSWPAGEILCCFLGISIHIHIRKMFFKGSSFGVQRARRREWKK